jgi:uncharacterized membrane-anchored protein
MKALPLVAFAVVAVIQCLVPLASIGKYEQVLEKGQLIKLKCAAPDPYDPLRGRYLAVRPTPQSVVSDIERGQRAFVTLKLDEEGFASPVSIGLERPKSGLYAQVERSWGDNFDWPFDRFHLNEKLAPEADTWFAENIRSAKGITAEVRVLDGTAVLADLSVDGKPMRQLLAERLNAKP